MKRALVIRNVASHEVPLDSLDNACVQAFTAHGFITELAVNVEAEILQRLVQSHARSSSSSLQAFQAAPPMRAHFATAPAAGSPFDAVLFRATGLPAHRLFPVLKLVRTLSRQIFLCVFSPQLIDDPQGRYQCFQDGASMVTGSLEDVHQVMQFIGSCGTGETLDTRVNGRFGSKRGPFTCPFCEKTGFTEDQLWRHCPLYHINEKNTDNLPCPICRETKRGPFQVHLHNAHGPPGRGEMASEFHMADSTLYAFALVVCHNKKYNTFLLVQEFANSGFWLPGGRIDSGESPEQAAIRETVEEAGIDIRLTGVIKMEYHPKKDRAGGQYVRMRFIFYAEPIDCDQPPKSIPDYESAGATWCHVDQVAALPLRGPEPVKYFKYVASGKPIYPLDMIHMSSSAS